MTRTIKFRAWDKKERRYWSEDEMDEIGGFYYTYGVSPDEECFDLQQFTGLFDKNGKEIYEGDVVKTDGGTTCGITFAHGAFWIGNAVMANINFKVHLIEIIGNIYENPELLNP